MIHVLIHSDAPPHLGGLYLHASVWVLGVKLSIHPTIYNRKHPGSEVNRPSISVIGSLQDGWGWHCSGTLDAFKHTYISGRWTQERMHLVEWVERQLEEAQSALFGAGVA